MSIIAWIVVGLLAGGLARRVVGAEKRGCLGTLAVGVIGAFIGGTLYRAVTGPDTKVFDGFDLGSVVVATLGAIALLLALDALSAGSSRSRRRR